MCQFGVCKMYMSVDVMLAAAPLGRIRALLSVTRHIATQISINHRNGHVLVWLKNHLTGGFAYKT